MPPAGVDRQRDLPPNHEKLPCTAIISSLRNSANLFESAMGYSIGRTGAGHTRIQRDKMSHA